VKIRCRKLADNDAIPASRGCGVVYLVADVEGWVENEAVKPDWALRGMEAE
jgi:hypothetical protein